MPCADSRDTFGRFRRSSPCGGTAWNDRVERQRIGAYPNCEFRVICGLEPGIGCSELLLGVWQADGTAFEASGIEILGFAYLLEVEAGFESNRIRLRLFDAAFKWGALRSPGKSLNHDATGETPIFRHIEMEDSSQRYDDIGVAD
jgi:hypothetical protein